MNNPNAPASLDAAVAAPDAAPHPLWYRLRRTQNWFFLGLTYAAYYLCRQNLSIVAPQFKEALGCSNSWYGFIKGSRDIAYGLGQFVNGLFVDRMGGRQALTLGAIGTVILNLLFGLTAWSKFAWLFVALAILRGLDGYVQSFGAPGWVKINAAWFRRPERGRFAGIFGGMIQLGVISVGKLWTLLSVGFAIPLIFFTLTVPSLDWRWMFIVPPAILLLITGMMVLAVKNHPEEVGYRIVHEDEAADDDPHAPAAMGEVFRKIAANPIVWVVSLAYMCTGFVRSGVETFWTIYLKEVWHAGAKSWEFGLLVVALPLSAFVGSFASGWASDKLGKGRRAPIAATLYALEACTIIAALLVTKFMSGAEMAALAALIALNLTCNSTHSILGTAAAMDLGGRKATGFALGLINSMQYVGSVQAAWGIAMLLDAFKAVAPRAPDVVPTSTLPASMPAVPDFDATVWFLSMLPYATLGAILMLYLTLRYGRSGVRGT